MSLGVRCFLTRDDYIHQNHWTHQWSLNWWHWPVRSIPSSADLVQTPKRNVGQNDRALDWLCHGKYIDSYIVWYYCTFQKDTYIPECISAIDGVSRLILEYVWDPLYVYVCYTVLIVSQSDSWHTLLPFHSLSQTRMQRNVSAPTDRSNFCLEYFRCSGAGLPSHVSTAFETSCMLRGWENGTLKDADDIIIRAVDCIGYTFSLRFVLHQYPSFFTPAVRNDITKFPLPILKDATNDPNDIKSYVCAVCSRDVLPVDGKPERCICLWRYWTRAIGKKLWQAESERHIQSMIKAGMQLYVLWREARRVLTLEQRRLFVNEASLDDFKLLMPRLPKPVDFGVVVANMFIGLLCTQKLPQSWRDRMCDLMAVEMANASGVGVFEQPLIPDVWSRAPLLCVTSRGEKSDSYEHALPPTYTPIHPQLRSLLCSD